MGKLWDPLLDSKNSLDFGCSFACIGQQLQVLLLCFYDSWTIAQFWPTRHCPSPAGWIQVEADVCWLVVRGWNFQMNMVIYWYIMCWYTYDTHIGRLQIHSLIHTNICVYIYIYTYSCTFESKTYHLYMITCITYITKKCPTPSFQPWRSQKIPQMPIITAPQKTAPRIDSHCPNGHQTSTVKTGVSPPLDLEKNCWFFHGGGKEFFKKHLVWQQKKSK